MARAHRFGDAGEFVITDALDASASWNSYSRNAFSDVAATVKPSFDYFVAKHFSLGAAVVLSHAQGMREDVASGAAVYWESNRAEIDARFGFDVRLGKWLSWYPVLLLGYGLGSSVQELGASRRSNSWDAVGISASAPLLVHPTEHFFVGFGPVLMAFAGLTLVVGGWW